MGLEKYPSGGANNKPAGRPARSAADAYKNRNKRPPLPGEAPHKWWMLAVLAMGLSLIVLDGTIVNVSLPVIIHDLQLSLSDAQWVSALYFVVFAALLMSVGSLADRVGRRNTFVFGIIIFVAGSLLAAASTSGGALIFSRAVQGVGGAFILPSTLSNVHANFRGKDRAIAFAVWGTTISAMAALGPLMGGLITTYARWQWIFLINLPIGIVLLIGAFLVVPNTKQAPAPDAPENPTFAHRYDPLGLVFSVLALGLLVFGFIEGPRLGWWTPNTTRPGVPSWLKDVAVSPVPFLLAIGALSLLAFILWEIRQGRKGNHVLLDMKLFRLGTFAWGNVTAMVVAVGEFSLMFVLPLYIVNALGVGTLTAGGLLAAMAVGALISGTVSSGLSRHLNAANVVVVGLGLEVIAIAILAGTLSAEPHLWRLAMILILYGIGLGLASAQLASTVLMDVPVAQSGMGSSTQSTFRQLGSAAGSAIAGTTLAISLSNTIPTNLSKIGTPAKLSQIFTDQTIVSAGANLRGMTMPPFHDLLILSFTHAVSVSLWVSMAALAIGFISSLRVWWVTRH